jgi:hypothetical protein
MAVMACMPALTAKTNSEEAAVALRNIYNGGRTEN